MSLTCHSPEPPALEIETSSLPDTLLIDIRGEADFSNHTKLQAALSRVTLRGIRVVHVRLTELTFCDLAAFRELLGFTEEARRRCGDITVHDADHTVRRIARVLDVEDQLTLC